MVHYLVRRLLQLVPLLIGISLVAFFCMHLIPGDRAQYLMGQRGTVEQLAELRKSLGLDLPLWRQYLIFLSRIARGDLGISYVTRNPVSVDILRSFPLTIELAAAALVPAVIIGVAVGVSAGTRPGSVFDGVIMVFALIGLSMPVFWVGLLMLTYLGYQFQLLPLGGITSAPLATRISGFYTLDALLTGGLPKLLDVMRHLVAPALSLATAPAAIIARMTRSSILEVLGEDFVRTARAKGLPERAVIFRHALRNSLIPVLTVVGLQFGALLSGAVVTETVFALPGLGRFAYQSIIGRDYAAVQGIVLVGGGSFALVNLVVDILYGFVDPRIRYD